MTAVRKEIAAYLVLAVVAAVQYLIVREREVAGSWFYLSSAVTFLGLGLFTVAQVLIRGADQIVRSMDERAAWIDARATRVAFTLSILAAYGLAFREALRTGEVFNPVTYLFAFMGAAWGVAWLVANRRTL